MGYPHYTTDCDPTGIYGAVAAERKRAHDKHGEKSMEGVGIAHEKRLRILLEEVGEVAKELNDAEVEERPVILIDLHAELVQVAAMACAWADGIAQTLATKPSWWRFPLPGCRCEACKEEE
jgi:hypothetical protein